MNRLSIVKTCLLAGSLLACFSVQASRPYPRKEITEDIRLLKLSDSAYVHVSEAEIDGFGSISSNGLLLIGKEGQAFLFDTPYTEQQTETLVKYIEDSLQCRVVGFVPNHWHQDCLGGLDYLHRIGVKSYAYRMTVDLALWNGKPVPQTAFEDSLRLDWEGPQAYCYYLGGGHAVDNIVVWVPSEGILFPGCMAKDVHSADPGNTADADMAAWPHTVEAVMARFPQAKTVIPGHGETGGMEVLVHTRRLLEAWENKEK